MNKELQEESLIGEDQVSHQNEKQLGAEYRKMLQFDRAYDFQWGIFFHAAILHLFYQFLIGPFIVLYGMLNLCTRDFYLLVNFAFLRVLAPSIRDTIVWAFLLVGYYTIFVTRGEACDCADLAMLVVLGINRVSVIGVKYATMGNE